MYPHQGFSYLCVHWIVINYLYSKICVGDSTPESSQRALAIGLNMVDYGDHRPITVCFKFNKI